MIKYNEDTTYNDIRYKAYMNWLDEMNEHEDLNVRGGVKLAKEYTQYLLDTISKLKEENELKNEYLKKYSKRK